MNAVIACLSLLGHGYVAGASDVISDLHALIRQGAAPEQRFGLRRATTAADGTARSPAAEDCDGCVLEAAARAIDDAGPDVADRAGGYVSCLREPSGGTDP